MSKSFKFKSDDELVGKATEIFEKLGLTFDSAVNIFLKQTVLKNGLPFPLVLLNEDISDSLNEFDDNYELKLSLQEQLALVQKKYEILFQKAMSKNKVELNSNLSEKIEDLKNKLANIKNESNSNSITEEAKENLKNKIEDLKSKLGTIKNEINSDSITEEAKENLKNKIEDLKSKLGTIKNEINSDSITEEAKDNLKNKIEELKNKLSAQKVEEKAKTSSETAEPVTKSESEIEKTTTAKTEAEIEAEKIAERVRQNEALTLQARKEEGISEKYIMAETTSQEEEIPTVSSIVSENKEEKNDVKEENPEPKAHEEDEDETAPDSMFDSWGSEEEIGCGC